MNIIYQRLFASARMLDEFQSTHHVTRRNWMEHTYAVMVDSYTYLPKTVIFAYIAVLEYNTD